MAMKSGNSAYRRVVLGLAFIIIMGLLAYAHHGWSEFDQNEEVTVTGVVEEPAFEYPHAKMKLNAEGETWDIIMAPPRRLNRMGVSDTNLQEGMTVTVTGHPHHENDNMMRIFEITIDDETISIR